jgi:hypothetical protein
MIDEALYTLVNHVPGRNKFPRRDRELELAELEDRVLFSASPAVMAPDAPDSFDLLASGTLFENAPAQEQLFASTAGDDLANGESFHWCWTTARRDGA